MNPRHISPIRHPPELQLTAVPSKSVTHRALIAAALSDGDTAVISPLLSDDTRVTLEGLEALGFALRVEPGRILVEGRAGEVPGGGVLFLGESGTSFRCLLPLGALGTRPTRMDGSNRLRQRPAQELLQALKELGARVQPSDGPSGLPLTIGGRRFSGGAIHVPSSRSSQFASALLLIGGCLDQGLDLELLPPVVSFPYVELTLDVLSRFGIPVVREDTYRLRVHQATGKACEFQVEGDHSSASYFLAAAAVTGGCVRVNGLNPESRQPDARLQQFLKTIGCRVSRGTDWVEVQGAEEIQAFSLDLGASPDLVPTLAVLALFAEGESTVHGVAHLRHKESDRLEVLASNLRALGRDAESLEDGLRIGRLRGVLKGAELSSASDHRIAMAFAIAGLRISGLSIDHPECVSKSNPDFWTDFRQLEG